MKAIHAALAAVMLATAGCATKLSPAPEATAVAGRGGGAVIEMDGVRLIARAGAWQGTPVQLEQQLTPLLVTIVNERSEPIHIGYNDLRLVSQNGRRYSALPPFSIDGTATVQVGTVYYPAAGFYYAPYLSPYFGPGAYFYGGPFAVNPLYWNRFAPVMRTVELPTPDMLRKALPEGVLEPGGRVTGFVYFEGVGPEVERVQLVADFRNPETRERVTRLGIPFIVG